MSRWLMSLAFLLLIIAILFFGLRPGHRQTFLADQVQTIGHFCVFGAFALLSAVMAPTLIPRVRNQRWMQYGVGLLSSVIAGALLEGAQSLIPTRTATWTDMAQDGLGAVTGILLLIAMDRPKATRPWQIALRKAAVPLCILLMLIGLWPLIACLNDYWQRNRVFPSLITFEQRWHETFLWQDAGTRVSAPPEALPVGWPTDRKSTLAEIRIAPSDAYPGVGVAEPFPDWHAYRYLTFDLYNLEADPLTLMLRVHDFEHNQDQYDRFHRLLTVEPGWQHFRIALRDVQTGPRDRLMNMHSIDGVKLFAIKPRKPIRFLWGNLQLE
jgi:VanZ family protein